MITFGNIYIIVKDFEKSIAFYKALFGKNVMAQNKTRFAVFNINGLGLCLMNGKFDAEHPTEVVKRGPYCALYDDMEKIIENENCGKIVINLCTDDLKAEYERTRSLELGNELTEIRYINAQNPYYYFSFKDPDGNTIEITGDYKTGELGVG